MAIVNYDDEFDLPPIDYDQIKVPKEIKDRSDGVRDAIFGRQNKEFLAQIGEIVSLYAKEAVETALDTALRQDAVETDFDALQRSNTEEAYWGAEIVVASDGEPTLQKRLDRDKTTTDALIRQKANQYEIDVTQDPYNVTPMNPTVGINQAIKDAHNAGGGTVRIPYSFAPYMIDPLISIKLMDDVNLKIDNGVTFKAKAVAQSSYRVFELVNTNHTNVYGRFKILGERNEHTGTGGEWGMGVEMRGASNAYFEYIEANDCWGDGVYIGSTPEQNYCENITIGELYADNNRRQGISVVSVKGLKISDGLLSGTNGTSPEAGIDFEPNNPSEFLQGIDVTIRTKGNAQYGAFFYFGNYIGSPNFIDINLNLKNSEQDNYGVAFSGGGNNQGEIEINHPLIQESNHYGINVRNWPSSNPKVTFIKPIVVDPLVTQSTTSDMYASAIIVTRLATDPEVGTVGEYIGNIEFIEPQVIETRSVKKIVTPIFVRNDKQVDKVEKISIIDPVRLDGTARKLLQQSENPIITDISGVLKLDMNDTIVSAGTTNFYSKYTTKGNTGPKSFAISNSFLVGTELEFLLENDHRLTITTSNRIVPIETAFSKRIYAEKEGARIKIRKIASNKWRVVEMVGTWTEENA